MVLGNLYSLGLLIESLEIVLSMNILAWKTQWTHSSVAIHLEVALGVVLKMEAKCLTRLRLI